jgi:hypothetical protein
LALGNSAEVEKLDAVIARRKAGNKPAGTEMANELAI